MDTLSESEPDGTICNPMAPGATTAAIELEMVAPMFVTSTRPTETTKKKRFFAFFFSEICDNQTKTRGFCLLLIRLIICACTAGIAAAIAISNTAAVVVIIAL